MICSHLVNAEEPSRPISIKCTEVKIIDGDTIKCFSEPTNTYHSIRLLGVDAPERKQICQDKDKNDYPCGIYAQDFVKELVGKEEVTCEIYKKDMYNRDLGICYANNLDIGQYLLEEGYAVVLIYSKQDKVLLSDYYKYEAKAKDYKKGIWAGTFEYPKDYRKATKNKAKEAKARKGDL
jgi:endonuclease YncB( thermonuclease family)